MNEVSPKKYIFSTPAQHSFGAILPGVLGITEAGRVEFTLDSGKLLFSAPVSLTKRKYFKTYGWIRFVVGPKVYIIQFHGYDSIDIASRNALVLAGALQAASDLQAWHEKLEPFAATPPDGKPIIASSTPKSQRAKARNRAIFYFIAVLAAIGGMLASQLVVPPILLSLGYTPDATRSASFAIAIVVIFAPLLAAALIQHAQKSKNAQLPLAAEIPTLLEETFPADTKPTAKVMSTWLIYLIIVLLVIIGASAFMWLVFSSV